MKKVLFLIFAVLCLVSCRTATVDDSAELETLVLVVEDTGKAYVSDDSALQVHDSSNSEEASVVPPVETGVDDSIIEEQIEDPTTDFNDDVETSAPLASEDEQLNAGDAIVGEALDVELQDSSSNGQAEEVIAIEESSDAAPSVEDETTSDHSNDAVDSVESVEPEDSVIENASDEPVMQQSSESAVVTSVVPKQVPNALPTTQTAEKKKVGFFRCMLDFILREKLFCFGVLTVFVGLVMLIVVLFRNIIKSARGSNHNDPNDTNGPMDESKSRHDDLSMDDDEFLRKLLDS